jgi:hypothetical protein
MDLSKVGSVLVLVCSMYSAPAKVAAVMSALVLLKVQYEDATPHIGSDGSLRGRFHSKTFTDLFNDGYIGRTRSLTPLVLIELVTDSLGFTPDWVMVQLPNGLLYRTQRTPAGKWHTQGCLVDEPGNWISGWTFETKEEVEHFHKTVGRS